MKQRYKKDLVATKFDPEVEELAALSRQTQENREKQAAAQLAEDHRRLIAAVAHHLQEDAAAAQAEETRNRNQRRLIRSQLRSLATRVRLCVAIGLGVILSWIVGLVELEFLLGVCFICACVVAFACGSSQEKKKQIGGVRK